MLPCMMFQVYQDAPGVIDLTCFHVHLLLLWSLVEKMLQLFHFFYEKFPFSECFAPVRSL